MLILHTSGTTQAPKKIGHSWGYIDECADATIKEIGLTGDDVVLGCLPPNTIAHYTITAYPAQKAKADYHSIKFESHEWIKKFKQVQPSVICLIPAHWEILKKAGQKPGEEEMDWKTLDMSCVRYMVTGSQKVSAEMITDFREHGVQLVANWYGMTEAPPPVMIGYNSTSFDRGTIDESRFHTMFHPVTATAQIYECIINGKATGDLFTAHEGRYEFYDRRWNRAGHRPAPKKTWKTSV